MEHLEYTSTLKIDGVTVFNTGNKALTVNIPDEMDGVELGVWLNKNRKKVKEWLDHPIPEDRYGIIDDTDELMDEGYLEGLDEPINTIDDDDEPF